AASTRPTACATASPPHPSPTINPKLSERPPNLTPEAGTAPVDLHRIPDATHRNSLGPHSRTRLSAPDHLLPAVRAAEYGIGNLSLRERSPHQRGSHPA